MPDRTAFNPPQPEGKPHIAHQPQYLALVDEHEIAAADGTYW